MFTVQNIISDKDGRFCGYRLKNPFGIILDIDERFAFHAFPLFPDNFCPSGGISAREVQNLITFGATKNCSHFLFSELAPMILEIKENPLPSIIIIGDSFSENYINIKNTSEANFTIRFPLSAPNLFQKTVVTLKKAEDFIRNKIEPMFDFNKVCLRNISKDGIVKYELIPHNSDSLNSIAEACALICEKYNVKAGIGEVCLSKDLIYNAIFLEFEQPVISLTNNISIYYTDNKLHLKEDCTGFIYNVEKIKDEITNNWQRLSSYHPLECDYEPISRLITMDNKTFYLVHGSKTVYSPFFAEDDALLMIKEAFDKMDILNVIASNKPYILRQKSYKNKLVSFRVPVDYSEIDVDVNLIQEAIANEFYESNWALDYSYETLDTRIEFLDSEVWLYIVVEG